MALIECPECAKRVSDVALACPQCGFPRPGSALEGDTPAAAEPSPVSVDDAHETGTAPRRGKVVREARKIYWWHRVISLLATVLMGLMLFVIYASAHSSLAKIIDGSKLISAELILVAVAAIATPICFFAIVGLVKLRLGPRLPLLIIVPTALLAFLAMLVAKSWMAMDASGSGISPAQFEDLQLVTVVQFGSWSMAAFIVASAAMVGLVRQRAEAKLHAAEGGQLQGGGPYAVALIFGIVLSCLVSVLAVSAASSHSLWVLATTFAVGWLMVGVLVHEALEMVAINDRVRKALIGIISLAGATALALGAMESMIGRGQDTLASSAWAACTCALALGLVWSRRSS